MTSVAAACVAEGLLAVAWWRFAEDPSARGLSLALWVWPLSWLGCLVLGWICLWLARRWDDGPFGVGWSTSMCDLFARALLLGVPLVVCGYAALMAIVAWSTLPK
ncbi:MAG: hypothetical protein MK077_05050 [Phycisphaerales bacterium]|nr:hypothetical protein [Phycisphaerales bacterium]